MLKVGVIGSQRVNYKGDVHLGHKHEMFIQGTAGSNGSARLPGQVVTTSKKKRNREATKRNTNE